MINLSTLARFKFQGQRLLQPPAQWHPEKNAFEWTPEKHIPHDPRAINVTQAVANFVVNEARRNHHAPRNQLEEDAFLIYNWAPEFTGKVRTQSAFLWFHVFEPAFVPTPASLPG